jgi:threonine dehydrogenase-like Zn-dependent dehydrogenase
VALDVGAHAYATLGENEGEQIDTLLGGKPDLVFECVGVVGMLGKAVERVRPSGTIVSMGFCTSPDSVVPAIATFKQIRLLFSMAYTVAEFEEVARTLDRGHLEPRKMITETVGLAALPATIEGLRTNATQIKVQVEPWS